MSTKSTTSKDGDLPEIVKKQLYTLKHYSFHLLLKYKSEIENIFYKQVDESYTSKTCGNCNNVKKGKNKSKEYNCKKCGITVDRDINGAYNILKKHKNLVLKFLI
jgi:putative transposase